MRVSVDVDERTLREIYFPAFERAVTKAQPWTVMCSYNKINDVFSSQSHWLLTEVLRDEWGYDGLVVSDWAPRTTAPPPSPAAWTSPCPARSRRGTTRSRTPCGTGSYLRRS